MNTFNQSNTNVQYLYYTRIHNEKMAVPFFSPDDATAIAKIHTLYDCPFAVFRLGSFNCSSFRVSINPKPELIYYFD